MVKHAPLTRERNTVTNRRPIVQQQVVVRDVTGIEEDFTLDTHGFQFVCHSTLVKRFDDEEVIKRQYYAETEEMLKVL